MGKGKTREREGLEAVMVQERGTVEPKVTAMGMERGGPAKGHSAG